MLCPQCGEQTGSDNVEICPYHLREEEGWADGNRVINKFIRTGRAGKWSKKKPKPPPEPIETIHETANVHFGEYAAEE